MIGELLTAPNYMGGDGRIIIYDPLVRIHILKEELTLYIS